MKKNGVLIVLLLAGLFMASCAPEASPAATIPAKTTGMAVTGIQAGNRAPDFNYELGGKSGTLGGLMGKPVVLNFWATWCGPCRLEIPFLEEIYQDKSGTDLVMLGVDVGEDSSTVNTFVHNNKMSLPVVMDSKNEISRKYRINAIPTTFFIDKSGIISSVKIGAFSGKAEIEKNLKGIMP